MQEREYVTLMGEGSSLFIDRKSRFIGRARHVEGEDEAYGYVETVKRAEKGARHNAYAFSLGECSEVVRSSDDGEPSGTAGRPCLEAIKTKGLTDCVVVVTRYFGGTLLGTGGLVRAYGLAAREALEGAGMGKRTDYCIMEITAEYPDWGRLSDLLGRKKASDVKAEFLERVHVSFMIEESMRKSLEGNVTDLLSGRAAAVLTGRRSLLSKI